MSGLSSECLTYSEDLSEPERLQLGRRPPPPPAASPDDSPRSLLGGALVYCPSESLGTSDILSMPINELLTMAGARGIPSLAARLGTGVVE
jgi:hypothetical protein